MIVFGQTGIIKAGLSLCSDYMWTLRIKTFPLATEGFKLNLFLIKKLCGAETTTRTTAETRKFNKRDTAKNQYEIASCLAGNRSAAD